MKKQAFLSILMIGFMSSHIQCVSAVDLQNSIQVGDIENFDGKLEDFFEKKTNSVVLRELKELVASGIDLKSVVHVPENMRLIDALFIYAGVMGLSCEVIKFLLDNGADINTQEPGNGDCLLTYYALQTKDIIMVKFLLNYGGLDLSVKNFDGEAVIGMLSDQSFPADSQERRDMDLIKNLLEEAALR